MNELAALIPFWLPIVCLVVALGAMVMTLLNLRIYRTTDPQTSLSHKPPSLAVCIPARNEQDNLEACVRAALANDLPDLSVLVYDDQSTDRTPQILATLIAEDPRVLAVPTRPLPPGWVGKQWACEQLGRAAHAEWLVFIDADVRLSPDALRRSLAFALQRNAALVSTFPRQITGTLAESLLIPLIHFILLSYLPFARMRNTTDPNASAGCGQFLMVRRDAYLASGTHAAFKDSMHDGIKMPRAIRRAGFHTDLFDGTDVASCRMYRGLLATWRGFAKNAYEGLGTPALLIFLTVLHLGGHVLPWLMTPLLLASDRAFTIPTVLCLLAIAVTLAQRSLLARHFRQSTLSALLHPLGVTLMTMIQWHSYLLSLTGRRGWRGRTITTGLNDPSATLSTHS